MLKCINFGYDRCSCPMVLLFRRCLRVLSVRIALYLISLLLWLVLIHVELRNCPVPSTKTVGLLPLFSVVYPRGRNKPKLPLVRRISDMLQTTCPPTCPLVQVLVHFVGPKLDALDRQNSGQCRAVNLEPFTSVQS